MCAAGNRPLPHGRVMACHAMWHLPLMCSLPCPGSQRTSTASFPATCTLILSSPRPTATPCPAQPHRDSEKEAGMFGTLSILLPAMYEVRALAWGEPAPALLLLHFTACMRRAPRVDGLLDSAHAWCACRAPACSAHVAQAAAKRTPTQPHHEQPSCRCAALQGGELVVSHNQWQERIDLAGENAAGACAFAAFYAGARCGWVHLHYWQLRACCVGVALRGAWRQQTSDLIRQALPRAALKQQKQQPPALPPQEQTASTRCCLCAAATAWCSHITWLHPAGRCRRCRRRRKASGSWAVVALDGPGGSWGCGLLSTAALLSPLLFRCPERGGCTCAQ